MSDTPFAILFVCLGNICRSPLAEGAFRHAVETAGLSSRFRIDSAGTAGYHIGSPPDRRAIAVARHHGFDIAPLRARQVAAGDFHRFDLILAMDTANLANLQALAPDDARADVALYRTRTEGIVASVPDPYYGGAPEFEAVCALVERGSRALLASLPAGTPGR